MVKCYLPFCRCWDLPWWCRSSGESNCWHLHTSQGPGTTALQVTVVLPVMHSQLERNSSLTKEGLWWSNNSDFIKSWPFIIFCVAQWGVWNMNHLCCIPRQCLSQGKPCCNCRSSKLSELLAFFHVSAFLLEEQLRLWLCRLRYLADIFSKSKIGVLLQGK